MQHHKFYYGARLNRPENIYDGDTITLDIDLGMHVWLYRQKFRLAGIDTPEVRGVERPEGLRVRDAVRDLMSPLIGQEDVIVVKTDKDDTGKYGRYIATIFILIDDVWLDLNQWLLDNGYAEPY